MKKEAARELLEKFKEFYNPDAILCHDRSIIESDIDDFLSTLPEEKEKPCVHPWSAVVGDGEMQPARCLACGKILS